MQDEMIIELFLLRDESAIVRTEEKYDRYLNKIAYNILADFEDSRESVNDTYLAAWESIPPNIPKILSTYLSKLTRRISIDLLRKKSRLKRGGSQYTESINELYDISSNDGLPEKELEMNELTSAINEFLHTLSKDACNTFIGRYYFFDSIGDIAKYTGISESKCKTLLFRTRKKLKSYLEKEGFEL